ncbi:hypothetical protein FOL47_000253, partial [Perkinsus chesapeaki]
MYILYIAMYGMKLKLRPSIATRHSAYAHSDTLRNGGTIYDLGLTVPAGQIWLFRHAARSKKQFRVLDKLGGLETGTVQFVTTYTDHNADWPVVGIEHTFYLRLRRAIKALGRAQFSIATSRATFRSLLDNLRGLYARLTRLHPQDVGGYRIELRFHVVQRSSPSVTQALQWVLDRNKISLDSYPDVSHTTVDYKDYLSLVDYFLTVAEKLNLAVGDNNSPLPENLQHYSAYLINLFGETNSIAQQLFDKGRDAYLHFSRLYKRHLESGDLGHELEASGEDTSYGGVLFRDEIVRRLYREVAWKRPFNRIKDKTGMLSYSVKKGYLPAGAEAPGTFNTYASAMKDILSRF